MVNETWRDQYDRMQRSFALLKQIGEPTPLPQDVIPALDVLYHFCCDVFHLRDWIAATVGTNQNQIDQIRSQLTNNVIVPSPELSACSDIANGSKHLVLHRRSYVTGTPQGHSKVASQGIGISPGSEVIQVSDSAKFALTGADGGRVETESEASPRAAPTGTVGYREDVFMIDIGGHQHDAQDVATKAVAAWDQWLAGSSTLAVQLRQT